MTNVYKPAHTSTKNHRMINPGISSEHEAYLDIAELTVSHYASVYECACLARDVYYDANEKRKSYWDAYQ